MKDAWRKGLTLGKASGDISQGTAPHTLELEDLFISLCLIVSDGLFFTEFSKLFFCNYKTFGFYYILVTPQFNYSGFKKNILLSWYLIL